ncbi:hypothetical protein I7I50_03713 [Histoplasma capsulatum G186AR]|uniref:Uncharacterized protein n=1 Tax=Ajellomyces capsulatus TaxID=5037 RepID=A0A8H7YPM3_AJECA|nr:hypothetical protein I7I52_04620 [Histoplasma capsulatum]QSS74790.1 hypothetical protein I7I50_03713 [Histoplasma capsulatum G186AR]
MVVSTSPCGIPTMEFRYIATMLSDHLVLNSGNLVTESCLSQHGSLGSFNLPKFRIINTPIQVLVRGSSLTCTRNLNLESQNRHLKPRQCKQQQF